MAQVCDPSRFVAAYNPRPPWLGGKVLMGGILSSPSRAKGTGVSVSATSARIGSFPRSLPMALLRAREAVARPFRASLRKHNLTEQQWRVLRALDGVDEINMTELAHQTFLHGPSLTRILKDLYARRLITRRTRTDDLRFGLVSIGAAGRRLIESASPEFEAIYAEITRRIGEQELMRIEEALKRIETKLARKIET
jgi:homoprotocatechuate degradation regulator HpaR